ncbi:ATP-binding protein [Paraburkholderia sp. MM6662-R1]|uniref:ATP-binding protein n=1 Tax=Paraburkholderia sp. MM6662-R1 TaxID=2991066 RepID=UPI003D1A3A84
MTRMTTKTKAESSAPQSGADSAATLRTQLMQLHLAYTLQHYEALASEAAAQHWSHVGYLARLVEGEAHRREDRSVARRVALARFPVLKTLDQFEWNWPTKINRLQVQNLFRLNFIEEHANVIFLGGVGLGKSHLSIALGHTACLRGYSVLFATAVDIINSVNAACAHGGLKRELRRYAKPRLLIIDLCAARRYVQSAAAATVHWGLETAVLHITGTSYCDSSVHLNGRFTCWNFSFPAIGRAMPPARKDR